MPEHIISKLGSGAVAIIEYTVLGTDQVTEETPDGPKTVIHEIRQLDAVRIETPKVKVIERYDTLRKADLQKLGASTTSRLTAGVVTVTLDAVQVVLDESVATSVRHVLRPSERNKPYPTRVAVHWQRKQHPDSPDKLGKR